MIPLTPLCKGDGCLLAYRCKRFTEQPIEGQEYFTDAPYRVIDDTLHCDMFWSDSESSPYEQLKEITNDQAGADK